MKNILLAVFVVFLCSACTPSSLQLASTDELILDQNDKQVKIATKLLEKTSTRYENVALTQAKYYTQSGVYFYENMQADINFELRFGPIETLVYIFDAKGVKTIYKDSRLNLLQLQVDKDVYINVLAESSSFNTLSYVYGFSNDSFKTLAKELKIGDITLKHEAITLESSQKHLSTWSVRMLFMQALVKPDVRSGISF